MSITRYFKAYNYYQYLDKLDTIESPLGLIKYFFEVVESDKIYLLIDEYDQFANAILAYNIKDFLELVGKGGFVRSFYEVLKGATQTGVVQKMFITGVTPITLDSLSYGFNIVSNISNEEKFNLMAGFSQEEVNYSLEQYIFKKCDSIDREALQEKLKIWYNGYLFNVKAIERVYNATLINYFISKYDEVRCEMPIKMLDSNVASDFITIQNEAFEEVLEFCIPNYVIKMLYFNYFAVELQQRNNLAISFDSRRPLIDLARGNLEPFKEQLNTSIKTLSNRDHYGFTEKHFHVITLALLSFLDKVKSIPKLRSFLLIGFKDRVLTILFG